MPHLDDIPRWVHPLRYRGPQRPTDLRIGLCLIAAILLGAALMVAFTHTMGVMP